MSWNFRCFFEIRVENDRKLGRIEFELYGEYAPKTVLCFVRLCTGQDKITYKGCPFHRIISGIMCQGGDVTEFNGSGGMTMYGEIFNKENFKLKHGGTGTHWLWYKLILLEDQKGKISTGPEIEPVTCLYCGCSLY